MEIFNVIDAMEWKDFLIFFSVFMGLVNFGAWIMLRKLETKNKHLTASAKELVNAVIKNGGFIDAGVLILLWGIGMISVISFNETVPKQAVVTKQEIKVDDKVYRCAPIRQRVIKYYDLQEQKTKPIKLPPKKECEK